MIPKKPVWIDVGVKNDFRKTLCGNKEPLPAVGSEGAVAWMHGRIFPPRRGYAPGDVRERGARLLHRVLPERGMLGDAHIGRIGLAPDSDQAACGVDSDVGVEARELIDTINRLPNAWVHEQQNSLQDVGRQLHRLGGGYNRLATVILDDAQRRSARNPERALELAQHRFSLVLKGGR